MNRKNCFANSHCISDDCPNIRFERCNDYWGEGIAEDCGMTKTKCKDCMYYKLNKCEDCLFYKSDKCELKGKQNE